MIDVSRNDYNYYYMRNAQGDVIALYNCYGDINSRYVYDSWGKLLSVTNASGTPITDQANKSGDGSMIIFLINNNHRTVP